MAMQRLGAVMAAADADAGGIEQGGEIVTGGKAIDGDGFFILRQSGERQDSNGNWILQGIPLDELIGDREFAAKPGGDIRLIGQNLANQIVTTWLAEAFGGGRHARRVNKIVDIEKRFSR